MKADEIVEMNLTEIKNVMVERFLFQLKNPDYRLRPLYLEGHAGIGKTQIVKYVSKTLSELIKEPVLCEILNLQFCERPDFMGLPKIDNDGNTTFARPKILPKEGRGILFLDEANRVDSDIQSGMLTLLEDRNINGHELGQDWMIVLAGNPSGSSGVGGHQYKVGDFDFALRDRIAKICVTGNFDELLCYLQEKYTGHILLKFLEYCPEFISFDGQGCSPRSFEYALRSTLNITDFNDPIFLRNLSVELGPHSAIHILKVLSSGYIPTIKNILRRDPKVYEYLDKNFDRPDVLLSVIDQIYNFITTNADKDENLKSDDVSAIVEFLMLLQNEHRVALFEKIRGSKYSVYFGKYFLKNTRLAEVLYVKRATAA